MAEAATPGRLHGFDSVRGLAAVAVVALHAAYAHSSYALPGLVWPVPIDDSSPVADAVFWWFEGSIMPLFFVLSGYFLARSLDRQSPLAVLRSRTRRLLLPMATIGFAVLALDLHVWVLGLITTGRATIEHYREMKFVPEIQQHLFGPAHLWYVEYLWLMCVTVCAVAWAVGTFRRTIRVVNRRQVGSVATLCGFAALSGAVCWILSRAPQVVLGFQHGWLPDPAKLAHGSVFLLFGMLLCRSELAVEWTRRFAPALCLAAVTAFAAVLPCIHAAFEAGRSGTTDFGLGGLLAVFAITATFASIGAGLRWLDQPSPMLSSLAAASFWIYLVHHPVLGLFQVGLRPLPMPAVVKLAASFAGTLIVCLVSYRLVVENRFLGRLLDGEWPWRAFRPPILLEADVRPSRKAA